MYPRLIIDIDKLRENLLILTEMCHARGIRVAVVTKAFCADTRICAMIENSLADLFADSRLENLAMIRTKKPRMLLRIPMFSEVFEAVNIADITLQSEPVTIRMTGQAAKEAGRKHKVILMVDMGDLREGIFYTDKERIWKAADAIVSCPALEFYGVGVNLTCFGGIIPDETNLGGLIRIAKTLRKRYSLPIPVISGGNSSMMTLLWENRIPKEINQLRLGESFLLGRNTENGLPIEGFHRDSFVLEAELVEVQRKPSKPVGKRRLNAFGERPAFEDKGEMLRGILAVGRQDVDPGGLSCLDEKVEILGASSDHLIVDLSQASAKYSVGETLKFTTNYGALLRLFTSRYVKKAYLEIGR